MNEIPKLQLVSFNLCPFVQRSVILLKEKAVDYDLVYIDLEDTPEWFKEISPLGKVPVLRVGDSSIFESAVIAEYLDESNPPSLHPADPLQKANHRAWIEFASSLLMTQFQMLNAGDQEAMEKERQSLYESLGRLSAQCDEAGPFFAGSEMSLIDISIAPLFMRMDLVEAKTDIQLYPDERIRRWSTALAARKSVKESVLESFETLFISWFEKKGGYLFPSTT